MVKTGVFLYLQHAIFGLFLNYFQLNIYWRRNEIDRMIEHFKRYPNMGSLGKKVVSLDFKNS